MPDAGPYAHHGRGNARREAPSHTRVSTKFRRQTSVRAGEAAREQGAPQEVRSRQAHRVASAIGAGLVTGVGRTVTGVKRRRPALALALVSLAALTGCTESPPPVADAGPSQTDAGAHDGAVDAGPGEDAPTFDPRELLGPGAVDFAPTGARSGDAGVGSFTFGVATASAQIEDDNTQNDWYVWSLPTARGGLGHGVFVNDAVQGFSRAVEDTQLLSDLHVDAYRFSVEWARVEPQRDQVDEAALAAYGRLLDALRARQIRPMITVHHFSSPRWVDDPLRRTPCPGPRDTDLCGWDHDAGAQQIIEELAEHAALLARRYGDRVDDWATLNEPVNYLLASYGLEQFPPGRNLLLTDIERLVSAFRNYLRAHVAIYNAIKANDTVDADGDGVAAHVGMTLSVAEWVPARAGRLSDNPADIAARDRVRYVYHYLFIDALVNGVFDPSLDGTPDEQHPEWRNHLDWLGLQYYFRSGVSATPALIPRINANVCFEGFRSACVPPLDPSKVVPLMRYEFFEPGIYNVLRDFGRRYAGLPLTVTEGGIAAENGQRRAENVVRSLEQIARARRDGVDVRGYYHWSLMDNYEWHLGFAPRFGLYRVTREGSRYARTATEGATVFGQIAQSRSLSTALRARYGGLGPMAPETTP